MLTNPKDLLKPPKPFKFLLGQIRNAGITPNLSAPYKAGIRFMNSSSLIAATLVLFFGVTLSIISGQYIILYIGIPETLFFSLAIFLQHKRYQKTAILVWHCTFCSATLIFGMLLSEVIDVIHMTNFLFLAPLLVLWSSQMWRTLLPVCWGLTILTALLNEVSKGINIIEPLHLNAYYWYFRPATLLTVFGLDIIAIIALFKELGTLYHKTVKEKNKAVRARKTLKKSTEELKMHTKILNHELRSPMANLKSITEHLYYTDASTLDVTTGIKRAKGIWQLSHTTNLSL